MNFGMLRCDGGTPSPAAPDSDAVRAAAAARRLDDTFRSYLAERGAKPLPLAEVTRLVTGVAGLRLAADAVLDLWERRRRRSSRRPDARPARDSEHGRTHQNLVRRSCRQPDQRRELRGPLAHDKLADGRLVEAVRHDLRGEDGRASATAVRMIWTADHLDAARRLQTVINEPARAAAEQRAARPLARVLPAHLPRRLR